MKKPAGAWFGRRRAIRYRLALAVGALALVAVTTVLSSASFTRTATNTDNLFVAGTLQITNSRDGQAVLTATDIRPGETRQGTCTITNSGPVAFSLQVLNAGVADSGTPPLSGALTLTIADAATGAQLWTGAWNTFSSISLGTFAPGQAQDYSFSLTFPTANAVPALQRAQATMVVRFQGTSL
jgi:spore coat-associated protein N